MRKFFIFAVLLTLVTAWGLEAVADSSVTRKRSFGLRGKGAGHVQLRSFLAPVRRSAKSRATSNVPVTVILTISKKKNVGKVCNNGPRINDALLQQWYRRPIPKSYLYDRKAKKGTNMGYKRTPAQKAEDKRLITAVNKALGQKHVTRIMVVKGAIKMGGGAITKLPFSSVNGCDELEQEGS